MPATYATWDPSYTNSLLTLSNGNLTATPAANSAGGSTYSTLSKSSGKWYWEVQIDPAGYAQQGQIGIATTRDTANYAYPGFTATSWSYYGYDAKKYNNSVGTPYGVTTVGGGALIGVALDADNGKLWFAKDGTWMNSGSPSAGTNAAFTGLSGNFYAAVGGNSGGSPHTFPFLTHTNFGASPFVYGAPSGFNPGLFIGGGNLFTRAPLSGLGTGGALFTNRME